jgi:phospholipid/cholesterol/gamma-HCH transport system substrate-binding protein
VQYLAPIIKNRQFNFPPIGANPIVGATARPNEITYSEDWMRPDYIPPPSANGAPDPAAPVASAPQDGLPPTGGTALVADPPPLAAEAQPTSPAGGLQSLMVPPGAGS